MFLTLLPAFTCLHSCQHARARVVYFTPILSLWRPTRLPGWLLMYQLARQPVPLPTSRCSVRHSTGVSCVEQHAQLVLGRNQEKSSCVHARLHAARRVSTFLCPNRVKSPNPTPLHINRHNIVLGTSSDWDHSASAPLRHHPLRGLPPRTCKEFLL